MKPDDHEIKNGTACCRKCGGELSEPFRNGNYVIRRHKTREQNKLCDYGLGEGDAVTESHAVAVCQAACPSDDCNGHCINDAGHPNGYHLCDAGEHQW